MVVIGDDEDESTFLIVAEVVATIVGRNRGDVLVSTQNSPT